jgi:serine/threonine protein kinase
MTLLLSIDDLESARPVKVSQNVNDYRTAPFGITESQLIGTGGFGAVRLRRDPRQGRRIAVKYFSNVSQKRGVLREVGIMVKLNHPCVLRILSWAMTEDLIDAEIHTDFASHRSLKEVLAKLSSGEKPRFWNPTRIGIVICSIVLGMRYIHSRRIIHHDLKPSNILINENEYAWICDFGASRSEDDEVSSEETGTVHYASPEQYEDGAVCTMKCDIFAFGLVLYEILTGAPVFPPSESPFSVIRRLRARDLPVLPAERGELVQTLIAQCFNQNPAERPSFGKIFDMFTAAHFEILPGADRVRIQGFADKILAWERKAKMAQSSAGHEAERSD